MKEIRFRAWNYHTNKMEYGYYPARCLFPFMGLVIEIIGNQNNEGTWDFKINRIFNGEIMQKVNFFKDKNGKEIYVGDIIERNTGTRYTVEYSKKYCKFEMHRIPDKYPLDFMELIAFNESIEVVGNKYDIK